MSSNPPVIPTAPAGTIWVAAVGPPLNFLMIASTMGSALVTMFMALFFFSTPALRRKPIFILNILSLLIGLTYAGLNIYEQFHALLQSTVPLDPKASIAIGTIDGLTPTLIDAILLLRLYAVYPYNRTPRLKFLIILGVPVIVKIGRIINAAFFLSNYARTIHETTTISGAGSILITLTFPSIKIEWSLQIFDDVWSSVIFLGHIYKRGAYRRDRTVSQTVRALFWISATNFVFPVMLSIVQLVVYFARPDNYLIALYVAQVNFYFTIMGVVFATLWVAEGRWKKDHLNQTPSESYNTATQLASDPFQSIQRPSPYGKTALSFAPTAPAVDINISRSTEIYPQSSNGSDIASTKVQTGSSAYELVERTIEA